LTARATEKGITVGTSHTTFSPDATVTRSQTVTLLWRMAHKPTVTTANLFGDVNDDAYYADAVLWASRRGSPPAPTPQPSAPMMVVPAHRS